ncbi:MAG: hypothetical protein SOZ71_10060 [Clostridium sp.]|nr:hypothetical protein [Clostridium sp.]
MKKVLIGVLIVTVAGGLGFGSYKLVSSLKSKSDTTVMNTVNNESSSTTVENETVSRELADGSSSSSNSSSTDTNENISVGSEEKAKEKLRDSGGYVITDSAEGTTNFSQFGNVDKFLEEYNKYIDSSVGTEYVYLGNNVKPPEGYTACKAYQVGDYLTLYTHFRHDVVMYVTITHPNKKLIKAHLGEAWSVYYECDDFMTIYNPGL